MTTEEKIELLEQEKAYMLSHGRDSQAIVLSEAIKALKQQPILDKLRTEIIAESFPEHEEISCCKIVYLKDVLAIIDSYEKN